MQKSRTVIVVLALARAYEVFLSSFGLTGSAPGFGAFGRPRMPVGSSCFAVSLPQPSPPARNTNVRQTANRYRAIKPLSSSGDAGLAQCQGGANQESRSASQ